MNTQKYVIASFAAGVWLFFYGFIVNVILLADFWAANGNPELMRAEDQQVMWAIVLSCLSQGFALAFIFVKGYENKGIVEGLRFGVLVAWFVASIYVLFYAIQPWGTTSTVVTMIVDGLMYIGAGAVLALFYRN